jgi:hypothetical protein
LTGSGAGEPPPRRSAPSSIDEWRGEEEIGPDLHPALLPCRSGGAGEGISGGGPLLRDAPAAGASSSMSFASMEALSSGRGGRVAAMELCHGEQRPSSPVPAGEPRSSPSPVLPP